MYLTIGAWASITVVMCVPGTPWDEAICYQASCYVPDLYENKVLLDFLWHF